MRRPDLPLTPRGAIVLASGFGAGYVRRAPGTFGALLGLGLGALLLLAGHVTLLAGILLVSMVGYLAVEASGHAAADPGWIVIDEIAGQMLALVALARVTWPGLLLAFALFRLFDITKPGPIGWADARHDAWGLMGDDWLAGAAAAIVLVLLRLILPAGWL